MLLYNSMRYSISVRRRHPGKMRGNKQYEHSQHEQKINDGADVGRLGVIVVPAICSPRIALCGMWNSLCNVMASCTINTLVVTC